MRSHVSVRRMASIWMLFVLGVAQLSGPSMAAAKSKSVPCADGAFQVQGVPLVAGAASPQTGTLRLRAASIDIGCGSPTAARVIAKKTFDQVTAKWKRCGSLTRVRLSAKLTKPDCGRLTGVLKAKKASARQFVAQRFSCGDGTLDVAGGEACDASASGGDAACPGRCSSLCVCNAVATTTSTTPTTSTSTTTTTAPCVSTPEVCDGLDNDCDGITDDGSGLCVLAHASTECSAGSCKVLSCNGTFANCDTQVANGCEIDTMSDPNNCGACGTACAGDNLCAGGICLARCNGQPAESCVTVEGEGLDERTNDTEGSAIPVVIGGAVDGTIGNVIADVPDFDFYSFDAVAGDLLRATISARAGGTFQAHGSIGNLQGNALRRIRPGDDDTSIATRELVIPRTGKYVLLVQDLRNELAATVGGAALTYRARLSRVMRAPDAATLPLVNEPGSVPTTGEVVLLSFDALEGQELSAETFADRLDPPSKVDTVLLLFDLSTTPPTLLAENDDHDDTLDSLVGVTAPTNGSYVLVVDAFDVKGLLPADREYELTLATPCFHCGEALEVPPESADAFCPGSFGELARFVGCLCGESGACNAQCTTFCSGSPSETCDACASDPMGCLTDLESCQADAAPNVCGDRFIRADEGCDDGNLIDGDGCSAACDVEPGFSCAGRPSSCGSCSDGVPNGSETDVDCGGGCAACGLTKACARSQDCSSGSCQNGTCGCPETFHLFALTSSTAGLFETAQWPGGTQAFQAAPGCSVEIANPSGGINSPFGDSFAVTQVQGFSACFGVLGEDADGCQTTSCPPLGIGSCLSARPLCTLAGNGSGSATYGVQCTP